MKHRFGGMLATVMMFIPLLAVPLLAVFGVPKFGRQKRGEEALVPADAVQSSASLGVGYSARHSADDARSPRGSSLATATNGNSQASAKAGSHPEDDPFAELDRPSFRTADNSQPNSGRNDSGSLSGRLPKNGVGQASTSHNESPFDAPFSENSGRKFGTGVSDRADAPLNRGSFLSLEEFDNSAKDSGSKGPGNSEPGDPFAARSGSIRNDSPTGNTRADSSVGSNAASDGRSWQDGMRRLKRYGAERVFVETGENDGEFFVGCLLPSAKNPQVSHRFEASDSTPLAAMQRLLMQLEEWTARR